MAGYVQLGQGYILSRLQSNGQKIILLWIIIECINKCIFYKVNKEAIYCDVLYVLHKCLYEMRDESKDMAIKLARKIDYHIYTSITI